MVVNCCSFGCTSRSGVNKDISFHQIPLNKERKLEWARAIKRMDPITKKLWIPGKHQLICSLHFKKEDFYLSKHKKMRMLKKSAIPSLFSWKKESEPKRGSRRSHDTEPLDVQESEDTSIVKNVSTKYIVKIVGVDHNYSCEPETLKRKYCETISKLEEVQSALANSRRREKRAKDCVNKALQELSEQKKVSDNAQKMLEEYKEFPVELFERPSQEYSDDQKKFATTLHCYSPKAYEFLREKLPLPHIGTLRRWESAI